MSCHVLVPSTSARIAEGDGAVLGGLEVDRHAERSAQLVVSAVPLADAGRRVVHAAGDAHGSELLRQLADGRRKVLMGRQRHDQNLGRRNGGREGQDLKKELVPLRMSRRRGK